MSARSTTSGEYVELHTKSFYSFGAGASHVHELLAQAREYRCDTLALTDTNLCGALEFARLAGSLGMKPITGGELILTDGSRIVLLAQDRKGYGNLSSLFTLANAHSRREPRLDPSYLHQYADGLVMLTGGRDGPLSQLLDAGKHAEARQQLSNYMRWFSPVRVYVELQQNFLKGDTVRNRTLADLARRAGAPLAATNDVLYHRPERYRLQHALVAARRNTTIDQALPHIKPNHHLCLKPPDRMEIIFRQYPEAAANTRRIAETCEFNLSTGLGYTLPNPEAPEGYTAESYLKQLCYEAAVRRYGSVTQQVEQRLEEEFRLIGRHGLAGFLLLYREIVLLAQNIMEEKGLISPETPLEERPPGRGRGSSVALLTGYLTGISHVDPLRWNLTLERFISEDTTILPDIDLDFPRQLRDELIRRIHRRFGPEHAVLAGATGTYSIKSIVQDLGKALGLPKEELKMLSRQLHSQDGGQLREEMLSLPGFRERVDAPGWRELTELAPQLTGAPRSLGQHVGGMILSSVPIPEMTPVRAGAMEGRYIMDWNKDSVADAGFAKIDLLSLPVLDQLEEALNLIEAREGHRPDLSQINPQDEAVYGLINSGLAKGVFLLQSPAQLKMAQRLKSRNLMDLAYQVALIRPGVGVQGSAVSQFVERYRHGAPWEYDHPLEERALERGCGIIIWQEQVVQLIMDVAGMTAAQADEIRRAFAKSNNAHLIEQHRRRFMEGAQERGVPSAVAGRIFAKLNGHYMFPESHSHAFAITAYQAAWLKRYHPVEFFVSLINNQPMGFYPVETLKQDARRSGVPFLNPCVNRSGPDCAPHEGSVLLGLRFIKDVGSASAELIVTEREQHGQYVGPADLVRRTGLKPQAVESLVMAGAFDELEPNRRKALWDAGLGLRPLRSGQRAFAREVNGHAPDLKDFTGWEKMAGEYRAMGVYPRGHLMEFVRPRLGRNVMTTQAVYALEEGAEALVAGWPIARQHPKGQDGTVFVTVEDEAEDLQLIIWPQVFQKHRRELQSRIILAHGKVSRRDGTTSLVAHGIRAIDPGVDMPPGHDWR